MAQWQSYTKNWAGTFSWNKKRNFFLPLIISRQRRHFARQLFNAILKSSICLKSQLGDVTKMIFLTTIEHRCQTQGPRAECGPPHHFVRPLTAWKMIYLIYPVLLFWRLQIKWICVIILEKCSCVQYFYSRINNNQMQRELFHKMFGSSLYSASVAPAL